MSYDSFDEKRFAKKQFRDEVVSFEASRPLGLRIGKTSLILALRSDVPARFNEFITPEVPGLLYDSQYVDVDRGTKGLWDSTPVTLGRSHAPDRMLYLANDPYISAQHAIVELSGNTFYITDQGSTNGTTVYYPRHETPALRAETTSGIETAEQTPVSIHGHTEIKQGRSVNDDAMMYSEAQGCAGVFDGVGGEAGSDVAARLAAETTEQMLSNLSTDMPKSLAMMAMKESLLQAHRRIRQYQPNGRIMTTATVAKLFYDSHINERYVAIASAGDSRAYLYRDGVLSHLTLDHNAMIDADESDQRRLQTTLSNFVRLEDIKDPEALQLFRQRHRVSSALGLYTDRVQVSSTTESARSGDVLLLTTDGIHDNLTDTEIAALLDQRSPERALIRAAQQRSRDHASPRAKPDDMTAVVMRIE